MVGSFSVDAITEMSLLKLKKRIKNKKKKKIFRARTSEYGLLRKCHQFLFDFFWCWMKKTRLVIVY